MKIHELIDYTAWKVGIGFGGEWMDGCIDASMNGWKGALMNGWMDGHSNEKKILIELEIQGQIILGRI